MSDQTTAVDILLVEDSAADAELCIGALRAHNLANNLVWVKDGAAALDQIFSTDEHGRRNSAGPTVILLDLGLPKVSGLEVLRRIKADEQTRAIPVVVLTSSKEDRDLVDSHNFGVNSFISEPVEFKAFAEVVARLGCYWLLTSQAPPAQEP